MKILYLDCSMGAAGDMLMGALYELCPDKEGFLSQLNAALGGLAEVYVRMYQEITDDDRLPEQIGALDLPEQVKRDAAAVYELVAQAESQVHGQPMEQIHFHELGSIDALADVLGVCLLLYRLAPERVLCSPVCVGSGTVRCAHGLLPVPAPATELLLRGLPVYAGTVQGELCTPTGAALLRHFAADFGPLPLMRVEALGQGTGTKDFETANLLRAFLGETEEQTAELLELSCNLDDMTAEAVAFAMEELLQAGALDVYTTAVGMKKGRPGLILSCLCRPAQREELLRLLFKHTSTLGVRETACRRAELRRELTTRQTALGPLRYKQARGWGVRREKPEYEDLARIARENGLSLRETEERIAGG